MNKECPVCHRLEINDTYDYYINDGSVLVELRKCECGKQILDHWKFCPKCQRVVVRDKCQK